MFLHGKGWELRILTEGNSHWALLWVVPVVPETNPLILPSFAHPGVHSDPALACHLCSKSSGGWLVYLAL